MEVISRKDARDAGLKRFFTGNPCLHGHVVERKTSDGSCVECNRVKWTKGNQKRRKPPRPKSPRTKAREQGLVTYYTGVPCDEGHDVDRYTKNGSCVECRRLYHLKLSSDPEWVEERNKRNRKRYQNNEEVRKQCSEYAKEHRKQVFEEDGDRLAKRRSTRAAAESKRRFMKKCSSSPHFEEEIGEIYYQAKLLQSKLEQCVVSDDPYDTVVNVDHIVPISNKYICGLHAPQNLRIIPARENFQKQATFHPYTEVYI